MNKTKKNTAHRFLSPHLLNVFCMYLKPHSRYSQSYHHTSLVYLCELLIILILLKMNNTLLFLNKNRFTLHWSQKKSVNSNNFFSVIVLSVVAGEDVQQGVSKVIYFCVSMSRHYMHGININRLLWWLLTLFLTKYDTRVKNQNSFRCLVFIIGLISNIGFLSKFLFIAIKCQGYNTRLSGLLFFCHF